MFPTPEPVRVASSEAVKQRYYSIYADVEEMGFLLSDNGSILKTSAVSVGMNYGELSLCEVRIEKDRKSISVTSWSRDGKPLENAKMVFAKPVYFQDLISIGKLRRGRPQEVSGNLHHYRGNIFGIRVVQGEGLALKERERLAAEMWAGDLDEDIELPSLPPKGDY